MTKKNLDSWTSLKTQEGTKIHQGSTIHAFVPHGPHEKMLVRQAMKSGKKMVRLARESEIKKIKTKEKPFDEDEVFDFDLSDKNVDAVMSQWSLEAQSVILSMEKEESKKEKNFLDLLKFSIKIPGGFSPGPGFVKIATGLSARKCLVLFKEAEKQSDEKNFVAQSLPEFQMASAIYFKDASIVIKRFEKLDQSKVLKTMFEDGKILKKVMKILTQS